LPTPFRDIRTCSEALVSTVETHVPQGSVVHFVGHSMGGLIVRDYLSRRVVAGLGRVVLIGTPNGGSPYANMLLGIPLSRDIFKGLSDLAEPGVQIPSPLNDPPPEMGIIAGTRPDPVRNFLLPDEHDGLVTVESARQVTAKDEMLIPCAHERLHWRRDTAEAVAAFLETGKFRRCEAQLKF
jgi:pimeloyl-ACP methyl ester carboxylesterase